MSLSFTGMVRGWRAPVLEQPGLFPRMLGGVRWHKHQSGSSRDGGNWDIAPPAMPGEGFDKGLAFLPR